MRDCVEIIVKWYLKNQRNLPWRADKNPYHVWVSEIMLQQTRIETVLDYYVRFLEAIPSIEALSKIDEDKLLKLWEGLGYYSRARNLGKAAKKIMEDFHGEFPTTYQDIRSLHGIGEYTAGAISSICFNLPEVAVDGNVMRVYCRVLDFDLDVRDLKVKKKIAQELKKILPDESGDFNQGIMELGETICLPSGIPKCEICPLMYHCRAHLNGRESLIPRKIPSKEKLEEEYTVFLIQCGPYFAIQKRRDNLLKNMWEFPNREGFLTYDEVQQLFPESIFIELGITHTHIFSHKKWFMNSYYVEMPKKLEEYRWIRLDEVVSSYAIPTAFQPFLENLKNKYSQKL